MSGYPLVLDGGTLAALVVGGGAVAQRKVCGLIAAGARVRVVALTVTTELRELARTSTQLTVVQAHFSLDDMLDATLVIAATSDSELNARIARAARAQGRLVNVVDAPALGNCVTPSAHTAGDIIIAVTAGGVPRAAARMRDEIAARFDDRYASAVRGLARARRGLLESGDREGWRRLESEALGPDFCESVESGAFAAKIMRWA